MLVCATKITFYWVRIIKMLLQNKLDLVVIKDTPVLHKFIGIPMNKLDVNSFVYEHFVRLNSIESKRITRVL